MAQPLRQEATKAAIKGTVRWPGPSAVDLLEFCGATGAAVIPDWSLTVLRGGEPPSLLPQICPPLPHRTTLVLAV